MTPADRPAAQPRAIDAGKAMAAATPVPPPSPAIYHSEVHKDRTAAEDRRA